MTTTHYLTPSDATPDEFCVVKVNSGAGGAWTAYHTPTDDYVYLCSGRKFRTAAQKMVETGEAANDLAWKRSEAAAKGLLAIARSVGLPCSTVAPRFAVPHAKSRA